MLTSKKIKKILLFVFLLVFFSSPLIMQAQLVEKWYYAVQSLTSGETHFGSFPNKTSCEADRNVKMTIYFGDAISICKNLGKDPNQVSVTDFLQSDFSQGTNPINSTPQNSAPIPYAPQTPAQNINQPAAQDQEKNYYPLQNLPGLGDVVQLAPNCVIDPVTKLSDCTPAKGFGDYLNILIRLFIGICAVLAMIMIVMGGIQYMTSELISSKQAAKQTITNAILGLLLALAAFAILFTLNPKLTDIGLQNIETANIINLPDAGDGTVDTSGDGTYNTKDPVSSGVASAVNKLKDGWEINLFKVYPENNRMLIYLKKGSATDNSSVIDIRPGVGGYAEIGEAKTGDRKTPKGSWYIVSINTPGNGKAIFNGDMSNMGASFWLLNPMTKGERGIGMHGNKEGTLQKTYGCLRLRNSDILELLPYVKSGIPVLIGVDTIGNTTNQPSTAQEKLTSVVYENTPNKLFRFYIDNYVKSNDHKYYVYKTGTTDKLLDGNITTNPPLSTISNTLFPKIKGQSVDVMVTKKGASIGTIKAIQIPN